MKIVMMRLGYGWVFLRVALGAVFIYASYYKIVSPGAFAHEIYNYHILPTWGINPAAIALPWLQLFCGLALILNKGVKGASLWAVVMMGIFQVAMASALARGLNISCGCFKSGGSKATWLTFARDFLILLGAFFQFWKSNHKASNDGLWMSKD